MSGHHSTGTLVPFNYGDAEVRVVQIDGEPWWVASDIARVLGYRDAYNLTRGLDDDERGTHTLRTPSGDQEMTIVCESGLYSAILRSRVERAADFRRWVTREVLPQIRWTGSYSPAPALPVDRTELLARAVLEATAALDEKEAHIRQLAPRAAVADELMDATGLITLQELAKAVGWGPNIIFRDLRRAGVLQGNRLPYQRYMHHFEVKLGTRKHPHTGETIPTHRTYVKPSAIPFLRRKLEGTTLTMDLEVAS